jgi:3'-phosphoadenosine 5'-phosphosulfate (PAPS) 3'-phosphatase
LLDAALAAARDARRCTERTLAGSGSTTGRRRASADFVTHVDREAESRILARLRPLFPGHRILAEEENRNGNGLGRIHAGVGTATGRGSSTRWTARRTTFTGIRCTRYRSRSRRRGRLEAAVV